MKIELLEGRNGTYLYFHGEKINTTIKVTESELKELRDALDNPSPLHD